MKATNQQLLIAGLLIAGSAMLTYYFTCKKNDEATKNAAPSVGSARATASTVQGGYACMDGNRPCAWQKDANGKYFCPCNLTSTSKSIIV